MTSIFAFLKETLHAREEISKGLEQVVGIEPTYPAWQASILTVVLHLLVKYT